MRFATILGLSCIIGLLASLVLLIYNVSEGKSLMAFINVMTAATFGFNAYTLRTLAAIRNR